MKVAIKKSLLVALLASNAFSAGYILPNGIILYDGSQDPTIYRVEKLSPQCQPKAPQTSSPTPERMDSFTPIQTNSVVIEEKTIFYERPVYIKERIIDRRPVYDVVDTVGVVIVYGLIYNAITHSFYHPKPHQDGKRHKYKR